MLCLVKSGPDKAVTIYLRVALAAAYLSAVADRFGIWGAHGQPGVSWGDFAHFLIYSRVLTAPITGTPALALAWIATIAEIVLALLLLVGWRLRLAAYSSGVLLLLFGLAMTHASGVKSPLAYSVFTASAASFLLGRVSDD